MRCIFQGNDRAYTEAGLKPEDITYINAHGTSTHLNDMLETKAVKIALGEEQARKVKINSTKSMTGHMLGGTGAVEAAVCALSIRDSFIHQTIGYTTPDPEVRSGLLRGRSGRDAGECRTVQLAGLRRTQCDTLLQEVHRLRRIRHE